MWAVQPSIQSMCCARVASLVQKSSATTLMRGRASRIMRIETLSRVEEAGVAIGRWLGNHNGPVAKLSPRANKMQD